MGDTSVATRRDRRRRAGRRIAGLQPAATNDGLTPAQRRAAELLALFFTRTLAASDPRGRGEEAPAVERLEPCGGNTGGAARRRCTTRPTAGLRVMTRLRGRSGIGALWTRETLGS